MIAAGFLVQTPLQTSTHTGLDWRLLNPARRLSNLKCVLGPWQHAEDLARYAEGLLNCEGQGAYSGGGRVAAAASDRLAVSSSAGCRTNAQHPFSTAFNEPEFNRDDRRASPSPMHRDVGIFSDTPASALWRTIPPNELENVMRGRVMMILASAVLAGSLLATGAQARGGGGGHGGGGGGGHMGGGGGHMGGFGGGHMGGFGGGHMGGFGGGHIAGRGRGHFDGGRRHFAGRGFYDDGLGCPYYVRYNRPYDCTY